jgi:hypothetical protein
MSDTLPQTLIIATAVTCGVLAAMALQAFLSHAGYDVVGLWQNLSSRGALQLRTAGPWWGMAGIAFLISGVTAAALARMPLPWQRLRLIRWIAGTALVLLLAEIGHSATAPTGASGGAHIAATLTALGVAGLTALLGAYFAGRR